MAVARTIADFGALGAPVGLGIGLAAPTIAHPRHPRADRPLPARHRHRAAGVVPALQRAGRGLRPRRPVDEGGAGRRRVGRQRPEGVDLGRAGPISACSSPAPNPTRRSTRASPSSRSTCTSPASRCAPLREMTGGDDVQRGVLQRRRRERRRRASAGATTAGRSPTRRSFTSAPGSARAVSAAWAARRSPGRGQSRTISRSAPATSFAARAEAARGRRAAGVQLVGARLHRPRSRPRSGRRSRGPPGARDVLHARRAAEDEHVAAQGRACHRW